MFIDNTKFELVFWYRSRSSEFALSLLSSDRHCVLNFNRSIIDADKNTHIQVDIRFVTFFLT